MEQSNVDILNENANKDSKVIPTQRDLLAGIVARHYAKQFMLPRDVVTSHERGEIHFLDIYDIIEQTMSARPARQVTALDDLFAEDEAARRYAASLLKKGR